MRLTAGKYLTRILLMLSSLLHVPRHCKSLKAFLFKKYLFVKSLMFMYYILIYLNHHLRLQVVVP